MSTESQHSQQHARTRPEQGHDPRPVIWSHVLWEHVAERRMEAEVLRRIQRLAEADAHDRETDRMSEALLRAEGDVYVTTEQAVQITQGAKAQTIRSWSRRVGKRRPQVRTLRRGQTILYHRDDLLKLATGGGKS